jgi:putative oxidoreductase
MQAETRYLPALGRLLIAVLFILAGFGKVMSPAGTQAYIAAGGLPFPLLAYLVTLVVELGGGVLLLVGYQSRMVAGVLAVFTLVTGAVFHNNFADQATLVQFLKNLAIAGGLLQVVAFGPGLLSLDSRRGATKGVPVPV